MCNFEAMKKAVAIFLLAIYGFAALGATIHAHYCMNRLTGFSVVLGNPNICNNCGMAKAKSHGCCHDEQRQVKADTEHQPAINNAQVKGFSGQAILTTFASNCIACLQSAASVNAISHAPPGPVAKKLYLVNRVFLI
jgi:hypothetical protein